MHVVGDDWHARAPGHLQHLLQTELVLAAIQFRHGVAAIAEQFAIAAVHGSGFTQQTLQSIPPRDRPHR